MIGFLREFREDGFLGLVIYLVFGLVALLLLLLMLWIGAEVYKPLFTKDEATFTVERKERIAEGDDGKYLVWTVEDEVFQNTDNLFLGKFDSSDLYGELHKGGTYTCEIIGWRIPFLSEYRNLIDCEES